MKILVIGDSCIDRFVYGECKRLSPEGPAPVFVQKEIKENKGMAGNVKENLIALGADVDLITNKELITKTRYVEDMRNHLFLRVDTEGEISSLNVDIDFEKYEAIVIVDYNKGFLTEKNLQEIIIKAKEKNKFCFLESKKLLGSWAINATFVKLNKAEYNLNDRNKMINIMDKLIITCGGEGCLFNGKHYPVKQVEIMDVAGAGDTFLAGFVVSYLKNKDIEKSINFAQKCASYVVSKKGVVTPDESYLLRSI